MAFATPANGICDHRKWHLRPSQMAFADHPFSTTATTLSARRPPPFRHVGNHACRRRHILLQKTALGRVPPFQYFNRTLLFKLAKTFLSQFESKDGCISLEILVSERLFPTIVPHFVGCLPSIIRMVPYLFQNFGRKSIYTVMHSSRPASIQKANTHFENMGK